MYRVWTLLLCLGSCLAEKSFQITGDPRTGVVLHEWPYESVGRECKIFLGPKNYSYAQVSVVLRRRDNISWIFSRRSTHFRVVLGHGRESKFKDMIKTCQNYGVGIIADITIDNGRYSRLNMNDPKISSGLMESLGWLLDQGVRGFRLEESKTGLSKPLDTHAIGRQSEPIILQDGIAPGKIFGHSNKVLYPVYGEVLRNTLKKKFSRSLKDIIRLLNDETLTYPGSRAAVYVDQSEWQRNSLIDGITFRHPKLLKMASAIMLAWPYGMPLIESNYFWPASTIQAQDSNRVMTPLDAWKEMKNKSIQFKSDAQPSCNQPWICEHRYPEISSMAKFRKVAGYEPVQNWQFLNDDAIAFDRGSKAFFALVSGNFSLENTTVRTNLPNGVYCNVISVRTENERCMNNFTVCNGKLNLSIDGRSDNPMVALHVDSLIENATIECPEKDSPLRVETNPRAENDSTSNEKPIIISPTNYNGFKFNITTRLSVDSRPNPIEITINLESVESEKLSNVTWLTTLSVCLSIIMLFVIVSFVILVILIYKKYFTYYFRWNDEAKQELK